ncbi:MAG: DUF3800 domain-containing protein [Candidatus Tagabacteria bacterium]
MLVFIDDSGDPGFKIDKGSSAYFVIAMVIFDDLLEAEKASVAIKELRRKLKFPDNMEFKFAKSCKDVRVKFLETINSFKFRIRSVVVEKSLIRSKELQTNKNSFYSYFIKEALKHSKLMGAKIRIDGSGDRLFRKSFLSYLRRELNNKEKHIIKDCKLINSKGNMLIQMVDMVAGAIRRSYIDSKKDSKLYRGVVKKHIDSCWEFK